MKLTVFPENIPEFKEMEDILSNFSELGYHRNIYKKALQIASSINQVEAVFILGSIAEEKADFFSDIDFYIICQEKKQIEIIQNQILSKVNQIAPIIHIYRSNAKLNDLIIYFKPLVKFELVIDTDINLAKNWKLGTSSILLFDRNGLGGKALKESQKLEFNLENHINEISNLAIELPSFCYMICGYLLRGEYVTSIDFISWIRRKMLRVSGFLLGIRDEGTRRAEERFPPELINYYTKLMVANFNEIWEKLHIILDWYSKWMVSRFTEHNITHTEKEVFLIRNLINNLKIKYDKLKKGA